MLKTNLRKLYVATTLLTSPVYANEVGNDAQHFNPTPGRNDFVTVHSASTLPQSRFNLGLYLNHGINTLPYENPDSQNRIKINDAVTGLDLLAAVGVHDRLELGVAVPFVVYQKVREDDTRGEFAKKGNTEVRPVIKWAFYRGDLSSLAMITSVNINRLVDDPSTGGTRGPTLNLEFAYSINLDPVILGANIGYRRRNPGQRIEGSLIEPTSDRILGSAAARINLTSKWALIGEVFGSHPSNSLDNETNRKISSTEALGGLRYKINDALNFDSGVGTEINNGLSTPDWRVYGGLIAEFGPKQKPDLPEKKVKQDNGPGVEEIPEGPPDAVFVFNNINFEFDSDFRVLPGALSELEKLRNHLAEHPYKTIVVEGHTDFKGTVEYNDDLSLRRSRTVRRHMIKHFTLDSQKVIAVGYGERRPATQDWSDSGRQINRRVEVKIYYP